MKYTNSKNYCENAPSGEWGNIITCNRAMLRANKKDVRLLETVNVPHLLAGLCNYTLIVTNPG